MSTTPEIKAEIIRQLASGNTAAFPVQFTSLSRALLNGLALSPTHWTVLIHGIDS